MHARRWELAGDGLVVIDTLSGTPQTAVARFRFAPGFEALAGAEGVAAAEAIRVAWKVKDATGALVPGTWYPRFGEAQPCRVLECTMDSDRMTTEFNWT